MRAIQLIVFLFRFFVLVVEDCCFVSGHYPCKKPKGDYICNLNSSSIDNASTTSTDPQLIPFFVYPLSEQPRLDKDNRVDTLSDTGSFAGSFIARRIIIKLNLTRNISKSTNKVCRVCSALDNHCYDISDAIDIILSYFCPDINNYYSFPIMAFLLEESKIDLITI